MKILVVGSGGREHAICWKLKQSRHDPELFCAPGNAGIAQIASCVPIAATDMEKLADFAIKEKIDLTVVGMDDPLVLGIVDYFESKGLRVFGPRKNAAVLEGSKAFSKWLMKKYHIPTADSAEFQNSEDAKAYVRSKKEYPIVLKADGLALGKGVLICENEAQALEGISQIMVEKKFGDAGNTLVIESFLKGQEVSVLAFCDGKTIRPMLSAQDHKRAFDNDEGPNTGGMGTFSPSVRYETCFREEAMEKIMMPTVKAMAAEGRVFKGILFFGLMMTDEGLKVLEYNARFGDPETQVVLPLLEGDLVDLFEACIDGTLAEQHFETRDGAAVCVVVASGGYPISYRKGFPITGLEKLSGRDDVFVFHAGTAKNEKGELVTNGGRVLGITAVAEDLERAREKAYGLARDVSFTDAFYRRDIGLKS